MLFLSFTYHRYREDAIIRIYADDRLIDELTLTEDIGLKVVDVTRPPIYHADWVGPHNRCSIFFLPRKNFLFEISEEHLHKKIRIEVQNDYTNHDNGFMTKFAHITFHEIFLFPSVLRDYKNWLKLRRFFWLGSENKSTWEPPSNHWARRPDAITNNLHYHRGGNFFIDIPLFRKHGMIHLSEIGPGKAYVYLWKLVILWAYKVLNTENEDSRSNNT
jgi:hypothetical protein